MPLPEAGRATAGPSLTKNVGKLSVKRLKRGADKAMVIRSVNDEGEAGTNLNRKTALANQMLYTPACRSREIVGRAVDVTVDSTAVRREVTDRPAMIRKNCHHAVSWKSFSEIPSFLCGRR